MGSVITSLSLRTVDPKAVLAFHTFGLDKNIYRTNARTPDVSDGIYSATYFTMIGTSVGLAATADNGERTRFKIHICNFTT